MGMLSLIMGGFQSCTHALGWCLWCTLLRFFLYDVIPTVFSSVDWIWGQLLYFFECRNFTYLANFKIKIGTGGLTSRSRSRRINFVAQAGKIQFFWFWMEVLYGHTLIFIVMTCVVGRSFFWRGVSSSGLSNLCLNITEDVCKFARKMVLVICLCEFWLRRFVQSDVSWIRVRHFILETSTQKGFCDIPMCILIA